MEILSPRSEVAARLHRSFRTGQAALCLMAACTMALCAMPPPAGGAEPHSEDSVKAAYLYRFAGYVDWKDKIPADAPFTIAVFGAPRVAGELRRLLPGHLVENRRVQVREVTGPQDVGTPQLLYAGPGHARALQALLAPTAGAPVLTVTDEDDGLKAGSAVNFLLIDHRIRFEVSLTSANRLGLKISSELLGVAVRVHGGARAT
jgi:hypothetical protein